MMNTAVKRYFAHQQDYTRHELALDNPHASEPCSRTRTVHDVEHQCHPIAVFPIALALSQ